MIVPYKVVWWDRPSLSYDEEIQLGKEIALNGRRPFFDAFLLSSHGIKKTDVTYSKGQKLASLLIMLLMLVAVFALGKGTQIFVALAVVLFFYFASVGISTVRLMLWLNRLTVQYARHVAKGR